MADKHVQEAFNNWLPRFIANNVDYSDLQRMMPKFDSWDDWCRVWSEQGAFHEKLATDAEAKGYRKTATDAYLRATIYYHFANCIYYQDYEQKEAAHWKKVELFQKAAPHFDPPSLRVEIPFEDTTIPAYYRTPNTPGPHPCTIMVCGLDSVKEQETEWEDALLARGMATLSFDGPGQGEMWFRQKMRVDYEAAIVAIVDWLSAKDEISSSQIGLIGHSMGGYFGARCAAGDQRIAAAVLIAGFYQPKSWDKASFFHKNGIKHIFGAATMDEAAQHAASLSLADVAHKITCPLLVMHGSKDTITLEKDSRRLADEAAGPVDLSIYPDGNHVMNNYAYMMRSEATDWMMEKIKAKG